jgi:hypothetical protein
MEPATKVCPECAEEIQAAALRCRFCGARVVPSAAWRRAGLVLLGLVAVFWALVALLMGATTMGKTIAPDHRIFVLVPDATASVWVAALWTVATAAALIAGWVGMTRGRTWSWPLAICALGSLTAAALVGLWTKRTGATVVGAGILLAALLTIGKAAADAGAWRRMSSLFWLGTIGAAICSVIIAASSN